MNLRTRRQDKAFHQPGVKGFLIRSAGTVYLPLEWSMAMMALLLVCLMMSGCERAPREGRHPHTPEVAVAVVRPERLVLTTELPGRTAPFRIAEIRPQVSGLILKRLFREGSNVKAGDLLYLVDPAPFQAALENARAALEKAVASQPPLRLKEKRFRELLSSRAVSQQNYDDAAAALKQAEADIKYWKAQVKTALINLAYTRITAPISGRIGKSFVTEGAIVTAYQGQALATIQQMDPIYVDVPRSTTELRRLKQHMGARQLQSDRENWTSVRLILEDGSVYPLKGTLQFQDVSVDPTTGSVILRMIFPNPKGILLPEMFVRVRVNEGINERAMLIPQQAVTRNPKGAPMVFIVDTGDKVAIRPITLGRAIRNRWLVLSGLAPGDQVIMEGLQFVRPGMTVKVVPFNENTKGTGIESPDAV